MLDVQADPDFLATVQNILECYRLRFPATHIHQSSMFDLQKTDSPKSKHKYDPIFISKAGQSPSSGEATL